MAVTRNDVAKHCNVSHTTVSNVLNNVPNKVSEEVKRKVLRGVRKLGYVPDEAARRLRMTGNKSRRKSLEGGHAGFIISEAAEGGFTNGYYAKLLNGILGECAGQNIRLLVDILKDDFRGGGELPGIMNSWSLDAMILPGSLPAEFMDYVVGKEIPMVQVGDERTDLTYIDSVSGQDFAGASMAVRHLIEKGHRSIAMINGPMAISSVGERYRGYRASLEAAGIPFDEKLVIPAHLGYQSGFKAGRVIAELGGKVTAVFAANDICAVGAMAGMEQSGLNIPGDISIIGYDNIELSAGVVPPLTTVEPNIDEMGRLAVRRLVERVRSGKESVPVHMKLPAHLVERGTVAPPQR